MCIFSGIVQKAKGMNGGGSSSPSKPPWDDNAAVGNQCVCCYVCPSHKNLAPQGPLSRMMLFWPQLCSPVDMVIAYKENAAKKPYCSHEAERNADEPCQWHRTEVSKSEKGCQCMRPDGCPPNAEVASLSTGSANGPNAYLTYAQRVDEQLRLNYKKEEEIVNAEQKLLENAKKRMANKPAAGDEPNAEAEEPAEEGEEEEGEDHLED
eukprot:gnl/TRDRNA2_/TRDRNA2_166923_c0_seq2.p1 gnl/TRDRNA2_/TRDRNA2_166923_c0~~gnl/TRDRNA2_/TRDRNA2_166923_c0_seq2.p1  ORF type:complete len:208 (+),score=36.70 gnl/TRDRNA2_/TRDRNA2_166923_c0_seq2:411-1034(+)